MIIELIQTEAMFFYGLVGLLSLVVGSFLNVAIYRLPLMLKHEWYQSCADFLKEQPGLESAVSALNKHKNPFPNVNLFLPGSACPHCDHRLSALDNIPVLSFLFLLGKCRHCHKKISARYPLVEIATLILSLLTANHFGATLAGCAALVFTWCLIVMVMIDFDCQLLPDDVTLSLLWLGVIASLFGVFVIPFAAIAGVVVGYVSLWCFFWAFKLLTKKEGMGLKSHLHIGAHCSRISSSQKVAISTY